MDAHGPYRISQRLPTWLSHLLSWPLYRKAQKQPEKIAESEHQTLLRHYEGGVRFVDKAWGRLQRELDSSGQLANTLVIITADHGEAFGEHGTYTHGVKGLFDEVLRVPLILRVPGQRTVPRVDGQAELTTIVPTILDLLGLPTPEYAVGHSAVPWLTGAVAPTEPVNEEAIANGDVSEQWAAAAVRTQEWKYILCYTGDREQTTSQLYRLATDPAELEECGQRYPEVVAQMNQRAEAHIRQLLDKVLPAQDLEEELPDEVVARLQALGYMD
jgi:arylsulfatase A-like enzyme